jgi:hypothetical protein
LGEWLLTTREVESQQIVDYCKSLGQDLMKEHEKRFADRIRAVRDASGSLANAAGRFELSVKNAWGTMDKTATEYGSRLAQGIQQRAQRLGRAEPEPKFREAEKFHKESVAALNEIVLTVRKYIPKLHKGLKSEMSALNTALAKLEIAVRALGETLDNSPGAKVELLQRDAERLQQKQAELLAARAEEAHQVLLVTKLSERQQELLRRQQELMSQGEFVELHKYEESLRAKEEEIKQFFQPLAKPLTKLERAADAKQISINITAVQGLMNDPVGTVSTAQPFAITQVMDQLDEAFESHRLDVEERKRRKAQETIQQIRSGAVEALRDDYLTIQANIQETLRQLRARGMLEKRDQVDGLLTQVRGEKEALETRSRDLQRKIDESAKELFKQKEAIESQVSKIAHRTLIVAVQ